MPGLPNNTNGNLKQKKDHQLSPGGPSNRRKSCGRLGEFKIIQHLSVTVDNSINDGISEDICLVHHQNIDDAVKLVKKFDQ